MEEINEKKQFKSKKDLKNFKKQSLDMVNAHRQMVQGKKFNSKKKPTAKQKKASDDHALRSAIDSYKAMGLHKKAKPKVTAKPVTKSFRDRLRSHSSARKPVKAPNAGGTAVAAAAPAAAAPEPKKAPAQTGFDPSTVKIKQEMSPDAKRVEWVRRQIMNPNQPRPRPSHYGAQAHVDEFLDHATFNAGKENWIGLHNAIPMIKGQYQKDLQAGSGKRGNAKRKHNREAKYAYKWRLRHAHQLESHHNPEHVPPGILSRLKRSLFGESRTEIVRNVVGLKMELLNNGK